MRLLNCNDRNKSARVLTVMWTCASLSLGACTQSTPKGVPDYEPLIAAAGNGAYAVAAGKSSTGRKNTLSFVFLDKYVAELGKMPYVLLEWFSPDDGVHGFILAADRGSDLELTSNIIPKNNRGRPTASEPGDVRIYFVPASPEWNSLFDSVATVVQGVGGVADVEDAETWFFTVRTKTLRRLVALHGYSFELFEDAPDTPTTSPDQERHATVKAFVEIWLRTLQSGVQPHRRVFSASP